MCATVQIDKQVTFASSSGEKIHGPAAEKAINNEKF